MARTTRLQKELADGLSQNGHHTKNKPTRTDQRYLQNYPPSFWDALPTVPLTRRALRELDRRNSIQGPPGPAEPAASTVDLVRFARHGGADLRHLRGYPTQRRTDRNMASRRSATAKAAPTARRSSPYDAAFQRHMIDNHIYPPFHVFPDHRPMPEPAHLSEFRQLLRTRRPSLSEAVFTDSEFVDFRNKALAVGDASARCNVIPMIAGDSDIPNDGHLPFTNTETMTQDATVQPNPDFFDGARLGSIDKDVRDGLSRLITPTKHPSVPVAPNFFLEVKGPGGSFAVALLQALHDGAFGARAMHALQNYGQDDVGFDGHAYTYSSIFQAGGGFFQLYGHHVTAPTAPGEPPEYHMTLLESVSMIGSREDFVKGATAFRNARDLAQNLRGRLIQVANTRARQLRREARQYADSARDEAVSSATSLSSRSSPGTQSGSGAMRKRAVSHILDQDHRSVKRRAR